MFTPSKLIDTLTGYAAINGYTIEHYTEKPAISEHVGIWNDRRSAVVAITDRNGDWYPIAPSKSTGTYDPLNVMRRVAYTMITGNEYQD